MIQLTALISFLIVILQLLSAETIPLPRLIEVRLKPRSVIRPLKAGKFQMQTLIEMLLNGLQKNANKFMDSQLIRELDPQLGNEGYVCPMRKKSDKFYSAHIFARSTAWSVEHCALMCLRLPECHSYNHVDYAKVCYYSKGPYRVAKKPSTVTNEKFYAPSSYIALARHFTFACRKQNNQEKDFRRRSGLHLNNNFYPGKPSFKPAERPSFDQREGHFYQVPHSSPWMVNLKIKKERCSGVLVPSSRFNTSQSDLILTAARCVTIPKSANPVLAEDVEVQFGKNNLRIQEYSFVAREIEKIAVYPAYDGDPEHGNDLAVLKLKEPIKYDRYVTPIKFPVKYTPYSHADCFTTGWETFLNAKRGYGREKSRDKLLQRFDVDILDDKKCGSIWGQSYNNKSAATYCAALKIRKSYLGCKVDHGSPLTCFENGGYVLYGLANIRSLHKNCKRFDYTHLGVKIPYVLTWIYGQDKLFASPRSPSPAIQQSPPALNRIAD